MSNLVSPIVPNGGGGTGNVTTSDTLILDNIMIGNGGVDLKDSGVPITVIGGINKVYRSVTTNTITTITDQVLEVNALQEPFPGGGDLEITLLNEVISATETRELIIRDGTGQLSIQQPIRIIASGGQTVNGQTDIVFSKANGDINLSLIGTDWRILGANNYNSALELNFDINTFPATDVMLFSFPQVFPDAGGPVSLELWWKNDLKQPFLIANFLNGRIFTAGYQMRQGLGAGFPVDNTFPEIDSGVALNTGTRYFTSNGLPDTASDFRPLGSGAELVFSFTAENGSIMPHVVKMTVDGGWGGLVPFSGTSLRVLIRNTGMPISFV